MKLLLTSTGLTNPEIARAFFDMAGKSPDKIQVAFVPTAARSPDELKYVEKSRKELIQNGILAKNILDIDIKNEYCQQKVYKSDVMYVCGGNTFYLLGQTRETGFGKVILEFIERGKLYFGVSAGTILITPDIGVANVEPFDPNEFNLTDFTGLEIINFEVSPHTPEIVSWENIENYAKNCGRKLYAISDKTAIKIVDKNIEVIGEKIYKVYN